MTSKQPWIWCNGNLQGSTFHRFIIQKNKLHLPIPYHDLPTIFRKKPFKSYGRLIYSWVSLVHISYFWLLHDTLVPVISYSHNYVPLKPDQKKYKVAFNIKFSTKFCLFGQLHFWQAKYEFCRTTTFKCIVHAQYIYVWHWTKFCSYGHPLLPTHFSPTQFCSYGHLCNTIFCS